jgi:PAS domain S-box-containing protein
MDIAEHMKEHFISLNQICDAIAEGVCIAGRDFNFIYWNDAAKKILFDDADDTPAEKWAARYGLYDVDTEKFLDYHALPMVKALEGETFEDYRILSRNALNPEGYYLSVNGRPLRNGNATVGAIMTFRNITPRVKLEKELLRQKEFYKNILDLMPGIVFLKDLTGKFVYGNSSFLDLLKAQNVVGLSTEDFLVREMASEIRRHDHLVITTSEAQQFEEVIFWKDGSRSIFHTTRFPYFDAKKVLLGVCAVAHDITKEVDQRKLLEEERKKSAHVSKLAALGTLAAEIAHELRNTLTILVTSGKLLEVILKDQKPDYHIVSKQVDVVNHATDRMGKIIHSLSGVSRESSRERPTRFSISDMFEDLRAITQHRMKSARISFRIEYPEGDPGQVLGNEIQLTEVFLNLILNAIEAVEERPPSSILIKARRTKALLQVEIHDSGPGVDEATRAKIFEPFFTTKEGRGGMGLGLSISQKIIGQHMGTLQYVEEGPDHYFLVNLPGESENSPI